MADGDVGEDEVRGRLRLDRGQECAGRHGLLDEVDALKQKIPFEDPWAVVDR